MKTSRLVFVVALAAALFTGLFATGGVGAFDFWWWMGTNAVVLLAAGFLLDPTYIPALRDDLRTHPLAKIAGGLVSAAVLYGVFWVGNRVLRAVIGSPAGEGIDHVYGFKEGATLVRVALTIAMLIGPTEEVFWRGLLQRNLALRLGPGRALAVATALYAGVHIASGNPVLVLAALVCGLFWGWMYLRWKSVLMNVVSHTVWDLLAFLVLPFHG
jgi:hypothetical protein